MDIRVQVLLALGEDVANQCLSADVLYGDVQLPGSLVRLTPQKAVADAQASVRIQSPQAINEPIVTVFVRAGCSTAFTRRFVLLADPLTEPAPSASGSSPVVVPALPSVESPSAAAPTRGAGGSVRSNNASAPAVRSAPRERQATTAPAAPRVPSVVRRSSPPVPKAATPRLQLDPIDLSLTVERDPTLKLSPLLLSEPAASPEARAAAGQLWKALSASPEQALQDGGKLAALEAEVAQLRSAQTQAQTRLDALNAEVEQARDQRYRNWLVYLLGGLLLVALLALLMLSRRRPARDEGSNASLAWWSPHEAQRADKAAPATVGSVAGPRKGPGPVPGKAAGHRRDLDQDSGPDSLSGLDDDGPSEPARTDAPVPAQATRERRDFSPSALGISRSVAAEELFDVQQQADFFVSLGEDDRAIQVLRSHIAESHEPSPLAYLDLFKLYHRLDRREAYDALRDEFNHVFNAGAPPFHRYTAQGQGLEAYESAFSRIQSLWPQPRVLDLIERSIFRDANDDQVEVFDLEAYRELLLLHAIAKDLIQRDGVALADHADFSHTNMRPLKADGRHGDDAREGRRTEPMPLDRMHPVSSHLGLDIDLDALEALQASSEISAFEASLPEVNVPVRPATGHERGDRPHGDGHLMDFEIVDFMPPDEDPAVDPNGRDGARKNRS
ncbi:hypothetical protein [Hydrogenophaga sp. BPS33]|uniref:hypothetical protein n=1 Tax=Hydrogenophaga sp. BPS33 TaxID=2651974 RepID=UPI00131FDC05|nr:hypothetical protein [Hydrogenophaga sp. BPS33]QHE85960.1 hypothetical protein F9K07_14110 [Hydrogenophaga sp. BPS33]